MSQISATIVDQTKTELDNPALEPLRGHLVDAGIGVACMQHCLQRLYGVRIQVAKIVHSTIKLDMRIADV